MLCAPTRTPPGYLGRDRETCRVERVQYLGAVAAAAVGLEADEHHAVVGAQRAHAVQGLGGGVGRQPLRCVARASRRPLRAGSVGKTCPIVPRIAQGGEVKVVEASVGDGLCKCALGETCLAGDGIEAYVHDPRRAHGP